jgi:hypothetical protein
MKTAIVKTAIENFPGHSVITEDGKEIIVVSDEYAAHCAAAEFDLQVVELTTIPGWFGITSK